MKDYKDTPEKRIKNHNCKAPKSTESSNWGGAVDECYELEGKLWAGNGEYDNIVKYCPFCGYTINN